MVVIGKWSVKCKLVEIIRNLCYLQVFKLQLCKRMMSCGMCRNQSYSNINIDETIPHLTNLPFLGDLKNMSKRNKYKFNIKKYKTLFFLRVCVCVLVFIKIQQLEINYVLSPTSELFMGCLGRGTFLPPAPTTTGFGTSVILLFRLNGFGARTAAWTIAVILQLDALGGLKRSEAWRKFQDLWNFDWNPTLLFGGANRKIHTSTSL